MVKNKRSRPSGYKPTPEAKEVLENSKKTRPLRMILTAISDHLKVAVFAVLGWLSFIYLPLPLSIAIHILLLWPLIANPQRGLENLLHDGSHLNWFRTRHSNATPTKAVNDWLVNLFAAYPVFAEVGAYRATHLPHHSNFGSSDDPETETYAELGLDDLERTSLKAYLAGVKNRIRSYALSWWIRIGTSWRTLRGALAWHITFYVLLGGTIGLWRGFVTGFEIALALWLTYWFVPLIFFLTPLRFVAESSEHRYRDGTTVFESTITNSGRLQRWFIHPHGDWVHSLHHVYPAIPQINLPGVHKQLLKIDPGYRARVTYRTRVVQDPRRDGQAIITDVPDPTGAAPEPD